MKLKNLLSFVNPGKAEDRRYQSLQETFRNKDILVTGGCGSIGSNIVRQLLALHPKRIKVFDNNESGLFHLQEDLQSPLLRILVGDIRDKERLRFAVRGTDIIFHAAALKHVPLCEYNPFEAVSTNVIGTKNIVEVARDEQVSKFIAISTDKAVNPINTMGATKLLAEKIVLTAELGDKCVTRFSCVRFGNVLNSVGSVIPIFKKQIAQGWPVTITSPEMVRFFMSMDEAVRLVLKTAQYSKGREIFILKMNKLRIIDLAEVMIEELAPKYNRHPQNLKIVAIGTRPGEKIAEELITKEEAEKTIDLGDLAVLTPHGNPNSGLRRKGITTNIQNGRLLTKAEIKEILYRHHILE